MSFRCVLRGANAQLPKLRLYSARPSTAWVSGGSVVMLQGEGFGGQSVGQGRCRIGPAPAGGSTVIRASGFLPDDNAEVIFPATIYNDTTASCSMPAVVVEGPVVLALSPNGVEWPAPFWYSTSVELTYIDLVDVTIGQRPYFSESFASLLVYSHLSLRADASAALHIRAMLPCANRSWVWVQRPVETSAATVAEIPMLGLASLPEIVNADLKIEVTVSGGVHNGTHITKWRRLMRAATPVPSGVEPVYISHKTRSVFVDGRPFTGMGWFLDGHRPIALNDLTDVTAEIRRVAAQGVNQVLLYSLPLHAPSQVRVFMDEMSRLGVKVWVDLQPLGFTGGAGMNYSTRWRSAQWRREVEGNITLFANHSATLGYYLCDDCCPVDANIDQVSLQAKLYNLVKHLDPFHLTSGAIQCNANTWLWSDVPAGTGERQTADVEVCIPTLDDRQPLLSLSLDVPLVENYAATLRAHAHSGGWSNKSGGAGPPDPIADVNVRGDGAFRNGLRFGALGNIAGLWQSQGSNSLVPGFGGGFERFPASPAFTATALWLAVIEAGTTSQLAFMIQDWNYGGGRPQCRVGNDCWPIRDWLLQEQAFHAWMFHAQALAPSFSAPLTLPSSHVALASTVLLRPAAVTDAYEPRVQLMSEECKDEGHYCLHLLVANVVTHSPISFTVRLGGPAMGAFSNATRIFGAEYDIHIENGELTDWVDAGATNIYELGCHGPRPNSSAPGWPPCSNRRGRCTAGWVDKVEGLCNDD